MTVFDHYDNNVIMIIDIYINFDCYSIMIGHYLNCANEVTVAFALQFCCIICLYDIQSSTLWKSAKSVNSRTRVDCYAVITAAHFLFKQMQIKNFGRECQIFADCNK